MASFKINIGRIRNCPTAEIIAKALQDVGLPEDEPAGVLECLAGSEAVTAKVVILDAVEVPQLDVETGDVETRSVERATVYPIGIFPNNPEAGRIEVYEGGASSLDAIACALALFGLPTFVDAIELDVVAAVRKLREKTKRFRLKTLKTSEYAHSSYICGPYSPKPLDTEHGTDFLDEYADFVTGASCEFELDGGKATVHLGTKASFRFSLKDEDDKPQMLTLLRELL